MMDHDGRIDAQILLLAQRGWPVGSIADLVGVSFDVVRAVLTQRGLALIYSAERHRVSLARPADAALRDEAERRAVPPAVLARRILEAALAGGPNFQPMVSALLDDGAE